MSRCIAPALVLGVGILLAPILAVGNGRPPAAVDVRFHPQDPNLILLSTTLGLLISRDDGASFSWICESAVGYGGTFDPDYVIADDGTVFASTQHGLRVSRDQGCNWQQPSGPVGEHWIEDIEIGPDGAVWVTTASSMITPNRIFTSTDQGHSFVPLSLEHAAAWWKSVRVAPSHSDRIYASGYAVGGTLPNGDIRGPEAFLYRSDDRGQTWAPLSLAGIELGVIPQLFVEAVGPDDADVVFVRSEAVELPGTDVLYRSVDGGSTWQPLLRTASQITDFVRRQNRDVLVSTVAEGVRISTDDGVTWTDARDQPRASCLGERGDGQLFVCGANWEPDFFALGRSATGAAWAPVLRFAEVHQPQACPADAVQSQVCLGQWPDLCRLYGCDPGLDPGPDPGLGGDRDGGPADPVAPPADGTDRGGCCDASASAAGCALPALMVLIASCWSRRRRPHTGHKQRVGA